MNTNTIVAKNHFLCCHSDPDEIGRRISLCKDNDEILRPEGIGTQDDNGNTVILIPMKSGEESHLLIIILPSSYSI